MRCALTHNRRNRDSTQELVFGPERVVLRSQLYRTVTVSPLMVTTLFGKRWNKFEVGEVKKRGKKTVMVHIASRKRIAEVFTLSERCATEFICDGGVKTCCGKVNVQRVVGNRRRNQLGYILEDLGEEWKVKLENGAVTNLRKPLWNDNDGYRYNHLKNDCTYISQYWPVRLKINLNGSLAFTCNRVMFENETNNINHWD